MLIGTHLFAYRTHKLATVKILSTFDLIGFHRRFKLFEIL